MNVLNRKEERGELDILEEIERDYMAEEFENYLIENSRITQEELEDIKYAKTGYRRRHEGAL